MAISFNPRANLLKRLAFVANIDRPLRAIWDRIKRQGKTLGWEQSAAAVGCPAGSKGASSSHRAPSDPCRRGLFRFAIRGGCGPFDRWHGGLYQHIA